MSKVPIYPRYISFRDFADALTADYPEAHLPTMYEEKDWFKWGAAVAGNPLFASFDIPVPTQVKSEKITPLYKTWQEWAEKLYICLINNLT